MQKDCIKLPFFRYTGRAHIKLTADQMAVRAKLLKKIQDGDFRWESAACLCGSFDCASIAETERYGLPIHTVICKQCGMLRTNPRLKSESLQIFYSAYYRDLYMGPEYGTTQVYFESMIRRGDVILQAILKAAPNYDLHNKKVLEIGCSAGGILLPFLREGAFVQGYDYDARYIEFGNQAEPRLNLKVGGLANLAGLAEKFDLIILNHVLEHLYDPIAAVQLLKDSLADDGMLYLGVPGLRSTVYYFSPTKSFMGSLHIGHVYHFTEESLESIMVGFRTLAVDGDIRAVFQRDDSVDKREHASDYEANLCYIKEYECDLIWKLRRLLMMAKTFPSLMDLILPKILCDFLRFMRNKVRGGI